MLALIASMLALIASMLAYPRGRWLAAICNSKFEWSPFETFWRFGEKPMQSLLSMRVDACIYHGDAFYNARLSPCDNKLQNVIANI